MNKLLFTWILKQQQAILLGENLHILGDFSLDSTLNSFAEMIIIPEFSKRDVQCKVIHMSVMSTDIDTKGIKRIHTCTLNRNIQQGVWCIAHAYEVRLLLKF